MDPTTPPTSTRRGRSAERALAVVLRTVHLGGVVLLGAALLGAPVGYAGAGLAMLASGIVLAILDLAAGRLRLDELAGAVVLVKLGAVAWLALARPGPAHAQAIFWALLAASSLSAHAPKALRHWRPGRAYCKRDSKADSPG